MSHRLTAHHGPSSQVAAPGQVSYSMHFESLKSFARELQAQIDAIGQSADHLADPVMAAVAFGDFNEANALRDRHAQALAEMTALLEQVLAAIHFAEQVTGTIAGSYTAADHAAAQSYGQVANG
jgi:hypothetical protein